MIDFAMTSDLRTRSELWRAKLRSLWHVSRELLAFVRPLIGQQTAGGEGRQAWVDHADRHLSPAPRRSRERRFS